MKNLISTDFNLDDLIFEHRNHAYGAFAIRKNYDKNMSRAAVFAVLLFVLAFLIPGIIKSLNQDDAVSCIPDEFIVNEVFDVPNLEKIIIQNNPQTSVIPHEQNAPVTESPTRVVDDAFNPLLDKPINNSSLEKPTGNTTSIINTDLLGSGNAFNGIGENSSSDNSSSGKVADDVFIVSDELPVFGEEYSALMNYLAGAIVYPQIARDNRIEGKVVIEFIIDKSGDVKAIKVLRGIGGGCDEEVMRVIKNMPKWKAGMNHGKPVNVKMVLPVAFKLS